MIALPVDSRRIGECAGFHAAREPNREAAVHGATRLSYRALDDAVTRWAKALLAAGVTRDDRVASLTPPSTEWLATMLGATETGAIWTGYHPRCRMPEFRHVTQLTEPTVLIAFRRIHGRDYAEELKTLKRESPSVSCLVMLDEPLAGGVMAPEFLAAGDAVPDSDLDAARRRVGLDDTAVLIFTSGTTGQPKAAMIKHRALLTGAAVENEHWPMDRPRLLHMMPVNHIAGVGMTGVFGLHVGGTLVFQDRFDPGDMLRLLEAERIDHVLGSPVQFHMMANHPDIATRDLSHLKFITWGGAPIGGQSGGPAARAAGRVAHQLRHDRAGPVRHVHRTRGRSGNALPDHRQTPPGIRHPGCRRIGRHRRAGRTRRDPGPGGLAAGGLLSRSNSDRRCLYCRRLVPHRRHREGMAGRQPGDRGPQQRDVHLRTSGAASAWPTTRRPSASRSVRSYPAFLSARSTSRR